MSEENLKYKTKKGIHWTFINQLCTNGLQFLVGVVMARLLSPSDYGVTALPAVFIAIALVFIESGFGSAMVRKQQLSEYDLSTAFYYSITIGLLCYATLFFAAPWIAGFYNTPILTLLIRITALSFIWIPLTTPQSIILKRDLNFKTPARISITTKIIGAIIGIILAYKGFGVWSLVIMHVVSSFLTFIQTWVAVKWIPRTGWSNNSFKYLWGYGNKILLSSLIDNVYRNITPIIIGKFYSTKLLGVYNRAKTYADLPSQQGTSVLQQVTFPVLSKIQDDKQSLAKSYRRMLRAAAFVIFPIMTLLAALAKPFVILLVTDKWVDSILLLQLMCFSTMWYPIHSINLNLLQVVGRSDLFLKMEIWKKSIGLVVMACTLPFGIVYFVAAGIISSFISLIINTYYSGKLINVGFKTQMRDLVPTYCLALCTFIVVLLLNTLFENLIIQLIVGATIGSTVYIGLSILFNFTELEDVKYMISKRK